MPSAAVVSLSGAIRIPMGTPGWAPARGYGDVAEDIRMVLWRQRTYAHEFLGADHDDRNAGLVMEMRNDLVCHGGH